MIKEIIWVFLWVALPVTVQAEAKTHYPKPVQQFLSKHCFSCHGNKKHKGDINYEINTKREDIIQNYRLWENAAEQVEFGEMPPKKKTQPSAKEKAIFSNWIHGVLKEAARKNANDPGHVVMRRLNRQELENTLRDLTGQTYDLSHKLPADGGGGEGFSNMGAALYTSPNHLEAYIKLFEEITNNASVLPATGVRFFNREIGDRSQSAIQNTIVKELRYQYHKLVTPHMPEKREDLRHKDYMLAAWMFKNKDVFKVETIDDCAKVYNLNTIYLSNWIKYLDSTEPKSRFLDSERVPFRTLPKATSSDIKKIPAKVHQILDEIVSDRMKWYHMQRPQQDSNAYHPYYKRLNLKRDMKFFTIMVTDAGDGTKGDVVIWKNPKIHKRVTGKKWKHETVHLKKHLQNHIQHLNKQKQTAERDKLIGYLNTQIARFGKALPGMKIAPEDVVIKGNDKMVVPIHNMGGFFDAHSVMWTKHPDLKIASVQQAVVDYANWGDVPDLVPGFIVVYDDRGTVRHKIFSEIHPMREIFGDQKFRRMLKIQENYQHPQKLPIVYYMSREQVTSMLKGPEKRLFEAMHGDYKAYYGTKQGHIDWRINQAPRKKDGTPDFAKYTKKQKQEYDGTIHWVTSNKKKLNEQVLKQLLDFAEKAWRRPIDAHEKHVLSLAYRESISKGLNSEAAGRILLQRIFLSPHFLYKVEKAKAGKEHIVSQMELANRLSYTLWASQPDHALMSIAKKDVLHQPHALNKQINRMLKDEKVIGLAKQFTGEWLEYKEFHKHTGLDKTKFPQVTSEIQTLMEKECEMFFKELIQKDRSVMDIFTGNYTYLNEDLARYYHIPNVVGKHFRKVNVAKYQRGGLLGMGAVLVKTSYPLRTSPVLRGTYILENILGHHLPAPPDNVPELEEVSKKSKKAMTVRQLLEVHRQNASCASCHDKIDPLGFALEGFGADGLLRSHDKGIKVDTQVKLKGVKPFQGPTGLKKYLQAEQDKLLKQLCRKFLGYSLGREVEIGDRAILEKMLSDLKKNQYRFSAMVRTLLNSKAFKYRRGKETAT